MTPRNIPRAPEKSPAQARVLRYRAGLAERGIRPHTLLCHDDDWPALRSLAAKMLNARKAQEDET